MQFPARDLSDKYISSSYQDVLQQYITTETLYVLDGYGNVVFTLPSASLGNTIITSDITSSMTVASASVSNVINVYQLSSSFASASISASYAENSNTSIFSTTALISDFADTASIALSASYSETSSLAEDSISASYALTASYALNAGGGGTNLESGSTYNITASWANYALTASYVANIPSGSTISASYALTASYSLDQGLSINNYDYSRVEYNGPFSQFSRCTYRVGGISGSITAIVDAYYSGSLFIGVSKSLG